MNRSLSAVGMVLLACNGFKLPQTATAGELGIVAIPAEVFTEIGLEIKRRSPLKPTFTIALANGWNGYLPTPQQHELGGYETWRARSSYLEIDASPKIVETLLKLLTEITAEDK